MDITDLGSIYNNPLTDLQQRLTAQKPAVTKGNTNPKIDKNSKLYKVSQEFEALFIKQMLDAMRKTVNKTGLIDGGYAEEIFEDMLYDKYALNMAQNANLGIADSLYRQLAAYDATAKSAG